MPSEVWELKKISMLIFRLLWQLNLIYLLLGRYIIWLSIVHSTSLPFLCQVYLGRFFSKSSESLDKIIISPPSIIVPRAALRALNKK